MALGREKVYTLIRPDAEKSVPVLIDSPHSGRIIPEDAGFDMSADTHRFYEDCDVDCLIEGTEQAGMTRLCAAFSRCYIDLNRAMSDIEDEMVAGQWPATTVRHPTDKAKLGFGLFRRLDNAQDRLQPPLTHRQAQRRLCQVYDPYHQAVEAEIHRLRVRHGSCLYLNMHSMPSRTAPLLATGPARFVRERADIVLSDRDGATCDRDTRNRLADHFRDQGFVVGINEHYKGGELIHAHGRPTQGINAIQIEINRNLYLDEDTYQPRADFDDFKDRLHSVLHKACTKKPALA